MEPRARPIASPASSNRVRLGDCGRRGRIALTTDRVITGAPPSAIIRLASSRVTACALAGSGYAKLSWKAG